MPNEQDNGVLIPWDSYHELKRLAEVKSFTNHEREEYDWVKQQQRKSEEQARVMQDKIFSLQKALDNLQFKYYALYSRNLWQRIFNQKPAS